MALGLPGGARHGVFVLALLWLSLSPVESQALSRPYVQGNLFVKEGDAYNLKCTHLSDRNGVTLSWTPPAGVTLPTPSVVRSVPSSGIYQVQSDIRGTAVRAINQGVFTCTASSGGNSASDLFRLRVRVPPSDPVIQGPQSVGSGVSSTWNCTSNGGEPAPNLSWRRGSGSAFISGTSISSTLNAQQTFDTVSYLTYTPTPADTQLQLVCEMTQDQTSGTKRAVFDVTVQLQPSVSVSSTSLTFLEGQRETINCTVIASPAATTVQWFKNGAVLDLSSGGFQFGTVAQPSLTFTSVKVTDEGSYVCSATNSKGQTNSSAVAVTVVYAPKAVVNATPFSTEPSRTVVIPCNVTANPPATSVTWFRNTGGVTSPVDVSRPDAKFRGGTTSDPSLIINNFSGSDVGTYTCTANNTRGMGQSAGVNVTTAYAPRDVTVNVTNGIVEGGSDVTLVCSADAMPVPRYSWTLRGREIATTSSLMLTNVTSSDSGNYTCKATNERGTLSTSAVLSVQYPPIMNTTTPDIGTKEGQSLTIPCPVSANPPPTNVTWTRDGVKVDVTQPRYSGGTLVTPDLTISDLASSDHGTYRCLVTNNRGSAISDKIVVTISYPPRNARTVPTGVAKVVEGNNLTLVCLADGVPTPSFTWTSGGRVVSVRSNFTLFSLATVNSGLYICQANNSQGSTSANFRLDVLYEPRVTSVAGGSVSVRRGGTVTLPCTVDANPSANRLVWYRKATPLDLSITRYSGGTPAAPNLTISDVQPSDRGSYICNVTNDVGIGYVTVSLVVAYPPTNVTITPPVVAVRELSPFTVTCSASANPVATISWFRGDSVFQRGATLSVLSARAEHNVIFTCMATNSEGNASRDLTVNVTFAPMVTTNQTQYGGDLHQSITLPCHVTSNPAPSKLRWMRLVGGSITPIDVAGSDGKYSGGALGNPSLTIHNLSSADFGRYRCDVTNSLGSGQSPEVNVSVTYPPQTVTVTGPASTVMEGTEIALACQADGFPTPTLSWHRLGSGVILAKGSTLRLTASAQDNAVFRCVATNARGQEVGQTTVSVSYKPKSAVTSPAVYVSVGNTVTLDCKVNSNPAPEVNGYTWQFGGQTLPGKTSRYLVVAVTNSSQYGAYTCTARNSAGTSAPIVINVGASPTTNAPVTGKSVEASLSVTTIVIIILIVLVVIAIIIMLIVCCYVQGLCSRICGKRQVKGQVHPEQGGVPADTRMNGFVPRYSTRVSSSGVVSRKDVNVNVVQNGHANGAAQRIRLDYDEPTVQDDSGGYIILDDGDQTKERDRGPTIALKSEDGQKPFALDPLKYPIDQPLRESPTLQRKKRRHRKKKKKRRREGEGETTAHGEWENQHLVGSQQNHGEATEETSKPRKSRRRARSETEEQQTTYENGVPVSEI